MFRSLEGKFGEFFRENEALLSNFHEKLGILKPFGGIPNIRPHIYENVPRAEYFKNIYH